MLKIDLRKNYETKNKINNNWTQETHFLWKIYVKKLFLFITLSNKQHLNYYLGSNRIRNIFRKDPSLTIAR